jgi:hypothetical protein
MKPHSKRLKPFPFAQVRGEKNHEASMNVSGAGFGPGRGSSVARRNALFRPWFGFALTGILCALALPLIALSVVSAAVCSAVYALWSPVQRRQLPIDSEIRKGWQSNEFAFERSIDAYEELIDAHARRHS